MPELLLHELHLTFVLAETTRDGFTLERLFKALDAIEPLERYRLLYMAPAFIGADSNYEIDDEEKLAEQVYQDFKRKCFDVVRTGFFEGAFVVSIVSLTLGGLRNWGCPVKSQESKRFFDDANKHFAEELAKRPDDAAVLEKIIRQNDEQLVNKEADRQLWSDRYKSFCEIVVAELLKP